MSNNHEEDVKQNSLLNLFTQSQETLDDAKRKNASESNTKTTYFPLTKDGTYAVRILPLAPVIDSDGNPLPMKRKGYEYPQKDIFLKIQGVDKKGKPTTKSVPVCHTSLAFPNKVDNDPIDLYVQLACEANSTDKEFCDKISGSTFNGGLKYNARRCMYVLDMDDRGKGLQILQLSFSQYKELEDAKLRMWNKLAQKRGNVPCPISSPIEAYPVEITRKTDKKTSYSIAIDTINGTDELTPEELQALLDAPRLPEVLYVYRRFHLEATIEALRQMDEQFNLKIMDSEDMQDCIDQIKMCLPADDQSHFNFGADDGDGEEGKGGKTTLDDLWDKYDELEEKGLDDRSEEGRELRTQIREFIEEHDLNVSVDRKKSTIAVLEELQDLLKDSKDDSANDEPEDDDDPVDDADDDNNPDNDTDDDDAEDDAPAPTRRTRNDDTNEPAARPSRRTTRPARRR